MKRTILAIIALAAIVIPAAAQARIESAFGVTIQSCVVNSSGGTTNGINVVYFNTHPSPATEVDFQVGYHGHQYVLIDRGTFSNGAQINHNLTNALVGMPWFGPKAHVCTVQRVVLANGRVLQ